MFAVGLVVGLWVQTCSELRKGMWCKRVQYAVSVPLLWRKLDGTRGDGELRYVLVEIRHAVVMYAVLRNANCGCAVNAECESCALNGGGCLGGCWMAVLLLGMLSPVGRGFHVN